MNITQCQPRRDQLVQPCIIALDNWWIHEEIYNTSSFSLDHLLWGQIWEFLFTANSKFGQNHLSIVWPIRLTCRMLCIYSIGAPIGPGQIPSENHYLSLLLCIRLPERTVQTNSSNTCNTWSVHAAYIRPTLHIHFRYTPVWSRSVAKQKESLHSEFSRFYLNMENSSDIVYNEEVGGITGCRPGWQYSSRFIPSFSLRFFLTRYSWELMARVHHLVIFLCHFSL